MIIDGKRYTGVQTFKQKGAAIYIMDVPSEHAGHWYHLTTFWANVTTADLKEGWVARFFQQKVPATRFEVLESSKGVCYETWRPVSWKQVPSEWKTLFKSAIEEWRLLPLR
tara:strand:+ start:133 stop:465 length:333 start_codon:yes stop_codon:yes gene_type:complete